MYSPTAEDLKGVNKVRRSIPNGSARGAEKSALLKMTPNSSRWFLTALFSFSVGLLFSFASMFVTRSGVPNSASSAAYYKKRDKAWLFYCIKRVSHYPKLANLQPPHLPWISQSFLLQEEIPNRVEKYLLTKYKILNRQVNENFPPWT